MAELSYKCLVLDHDDTTVKSTPDIHYPQWVETLEALRPETKMSLEEFMNHNCEIGFFRMCEEVMHFTEYEKKTQYTMWRDYMRSHVASFYEGMPEIITEFHRAGGIICVCTHNSQPHILRDYEAQFGGEFEPDMIFDYDKYPEHIKPDPFALKEIMRIYGFTPDEILMVDDMKPGYDMAKSVGVPFAGAGWSHIVPKIKAVMRANSDFYLETTEQLRDLLFKKD